MRRWVTEQLCADGTRPVVVIDHLGIVTDGEFGDAFGDSVVIRRVAGWFQLRQTWERIGRHRDPSSGTPVIVVSDPEVHAAEDLPFDIEQQSVVLRMRVPAKGPAVAVVLALDPEQSDIVVERLKTGTQGEADAVLTALTALPACDLATAPETQFRVALRLHEHPQPAVVLQLAQMALTDPLARAFLHDSPEVQVVQDAWSDWVNDPAGSRWKQHFEECGTEVTGLLLSGTLKPVRSELGGLPTWASIGLRSESPGERVNAMLDVSPDPPADFLDWTKVAQWWGEIRSNLALINPPDEMIATRAWDRWADLNLSFQRWLRSNYGSQFSRTWTSGPITVDKVQPFLKHRLSTSRRIMLIVLDGMGFAQWTLIRERAQLRIIRSSGILAMVPTLTEVSRQAIAAGAPPIEFVDSLGRTNKESTHWTKAWEDRTHEPFWKRIDGVSIGELDALPIDTTDVIGVVLSATDNLMHDAGLLGDVSLHANLDVWIKSRVLDTLIRRASDHGYETWITADHGNLECVSISAENERAFVERSGSRVRRYATKVLRDASDVNGDRWDEIPGFPDDEAQRLLFAPGRTGWGPSKVSHGGLSFDEVIVPFVQVEPS